MPEKSLIEAKLLMTHRRVGDTVRVVGCAILPSDAGVLMAGDSWGGWDVNCDIAIGMRRAAASLMLGWLVLLKRSKGSGWLLAELP